MFERTRDLVDAALREESLPSVAVAAARGDEVLWEEAVGWADRERRVPATVDTMYSLASISKPFTTTGLMILVERGKIDLDRPINDYLAEAKLAGRAGDSAEATVRRVANHTAGLSLHYQFFYDDEPRARPSMDETIRRYGSLISAPGTRYQYSNLGFGILEYIIERADGRSFADFMREEVFLPLGMFHTSVDIGPGLETFAATRYAADGLPYPFYTFDHPGASAVYSSARDLLRFGMFHIGHSGPDQKQILSPEALKEMQRITAHSLPGRAAGVGWRLIEDDMGFVSVGHDGGMGGVQTSLRMIPSEGITVVALCNSSKRAGLVPYGLPEELFSEMLPEYSRRYRAAQAEGLFAGPEEPAPVPPFEPPAALVGEWEGTVLTMSGERPLTLWFHPDGDVVARYAGQLRSLVNDAALVDGRVIGRFLGDIDTPDCSYRPHYLQLDLGWEGDVLQGALLAVTLPSDSGTPGRRVGNALNHWTRLERVRS
jgi:CubicO group peptidase (beta-lactamase class C family)